MARALLVGTGFSAAPLLAALEAAGHEVSVVGGNPDDALVRAGARHLAVDYSDVAALRATVEVAAGDGDVVLVPGCTDVALLSCAEVADALGIPGHDRPDAVRRLLDKRGFRQLCAELGLASPRLLDDDDAVGHDVVVKPARGYSGHGISVLHAPSRDDLASAVERARAACSLGEHVTEELARGELYSHSAFLVGGRVVTEFWVREEGAADPLAVDVSALSAPGDAVAAAVRDDVHALADALTLTDGLVHTQLLVDDGTHSIVEVTRRCPGDLYAELVRRSTGFDHAAAYCAGFTGDATPTASSPTSRHVLRTTISPVGPTTLGAVALPAGLPPATLVPLARAGDRLGAGPRGRLGVLFLECRDEDELARWWGRARRRELHVPRPAVADS